MSENRVSTISAIVGFIMALTALPAAAQWCMLGCQFPPGWTPGPADPRTQGSAPACGLQSSHVPAGPCHCESDRPVLSTDPMTGHLRCDTRENARELQKLRERGLWGAERPIVLAQTDWSRERPRDSLGNLVAKPSGWEDDTGWVPSRDGRVQHRCAGKWEKPDTWHCEWRPKINILD
jgi:hypothetical protein